MISTRDQQPPNHTDSNIEFEPDLEDMAAKECTRLEGNGQKHEAYLVVDEDTGGNTSQQKASVLCIFSNNDPN